MKRTLLNLLPAIFIWFGSCYLASAQDVAQSDQITQDGAILQGDESDTGSFETVTVDAGTESSVTLQFPVSMAGKPVAVEALDGGTVSGDAGTPTIAVDGSLAFSFSVTTQPGIHRVIVVDPNADADSPHIVALVRFEVPPAGQ